VQPKVVATRRLGDAQIDPKIIVHPPATSIGELPPGTQVAQNEYPHLRLLPIESTNSALPETQQTGPAIKLKRFPPQWPSVRPAGPSHQRAQTKTPDAG